MKKGLKKILKKILCLALAVLTLASADVSVRAARKEETLMTIPVWQRGDIVLHSEKQYGNPYTDVDVDAVFVHESGEEIRLYGFWNGGDEWRVRFAPTRTGEWTYTVSCSDPENASLNGVTGTLTSVPNDGATELDRHGFIRVSDNGRYFVYDDGTPFYWLGDTDWQAPNYVSIDRCNYPGCGCGNQFLHEVENRLAKGFTVYQTYFDGAESDGGGQRGASPEPAMWAEKYTLPNVEAFNEKYDVMFDELAKRGMVIALGFGVHASTVNSMRQAELDRLSRYLTARYAAYPVVWITAQEITGDPQFEPWLSSAAVTAAGDGYRHPQSAHQYPLPADNEFVRRLDAQPWHTFFTLQNGHGPIGEKNTYHGYWNNGGASPKPFIESEANYEDIWCGGFNGYEKSRISAWKANLCGSYGFTYGVTGIWANCWSTAGSTGWLGSFSTEPWYMGLDKPGSFEMKYMADFFRYTDFSRLVPRFNDRKYSDCVAETKAVSSSENADTYVAYFYNTDRTTGTLRGLNRNGTYRAAWYDPLTGKFIDICDRIKPLLGTYTIPLKPTAGDWALLVTGRDLGEYETEPAPAANGDLAFADTSSRVPRQLPDYGGEKLSPAAVCVGSMVYDASGNLTDTAPCLTDGDLTTEWRPFSMEATQTILLDLERERDLTGLNVILGKDADRLSVRVYGSLDGESWRVLADDALRPFTTCRADRLEGRTVLTTALEGRCRYVKLLVMGVGREGHKAIAELELFVDGTANPSFAQRVINAIKDFFSRILAFLRKLSGGRLLADPAPSP